MIPLGSPTGWRKEEYRTTLPQDSQSPYITIFLGEVTPIEEVDPTEITTNNDADSYNLLSVNLIANIETLFNQASFDRFKLAIDGDNLLDLEYQLQPEVNLCALSRKGEGD